ncbi:MAG: polysaccharide deacetylase [Planctomycetota bacterium]|nr:polysaccharide deacetylase [Planctomycetota bacterium]
MKPGVYITVDVECSMGGAFANTTLRPVPPSRGMMGEYAGRRLGIPLITEILDGSGLKATFFVETFAEEQGYPGQTEPVCEYLLGHGQDVQLHIHPAYKQYDLFRRGLAPCPTTDDLTELPRNRQLELLREGAERIRRWTGRAPVAFRAGNMAASEETLELLAAAGIRIDSSYTFPFAGGQCRFSPAAPYNGSRWYGDVLELALSGFTLPPLPGEARAKPLDIVGVSFEECRDAIRRICGAGADAVLIFHSFSLFKVRNYQYEGGRLNWIVTRRLRRLCEWLAGHADEFPAYTFSQLVAAIADKHYEARAVPPPRLSGARGILRKAVQAYNCLYWT